jgi:hypothetical protein
MYRVLNIYKVERREGRQRPEEETSPRLVGLAEKGEAEAQRVSR